MYSEETAPPGLWKSEILFALCLWLIASPFIVSAGTSMIYNNWIVGFIAGNTAISEEGNRKWERPAAAAAAIWLYISGFVPSVLSGQALLANQIGIGVILVLTALS